MLLLNVSYKKIIHWKWSTLMLIQVSYIMTNYPSNLLKKKILQFSYLCNLRLRYRLHILTPRDLTSKDDTTVKKRWSPKMKTITHPIFDKCFIDVNNDWTTLSKVNLNLQSSEVTKCSTYVNKKKACSDSKTFLKNNKFRTYIYFKLYKLIVEC